MDKANAVFSMVGILTTAYFLGFPVYWLIGRPLNWVGEKFGHSKAMLQVMNTELDLMNGELPSWARRFN
jgi:hypothetical protein